MFRNCDQLGDVVDTYAERPREGLSLLRHNLVDLGCEAVVVDGVFVRSRRVSSAMAVEHMDLPTIS